MTKADLIERVSKDTGPKTSKRAIARVIDRTFEHLHRAIRKDKRFSYPGFGTWTVKKRKARKGRNPKTGEIIAIPPTKTVSFKPAPDFKASL